MTESSELDRRAEFYYELSRKRVSGRPSWKTLIYSNDPYNMGLKKIAYREALEEKVYRLFDIQYFKYFKTTTLVPIHTIRLTNEITGEVRTWEKQTATITIFLFRRGPRMGQMKSIEIVSKIDEYVILAADIKAGRVQLWIEKDEEDVAQNSQPLGTDSQSNQAISE